MNYFLFKKIEIIPGETSEGFISLKQLSPIDEKDKIVINGAYYLLNAFAGE